MRGTPPLELHQRTLGARGLVRDQRIGKLEKRMTAAERSIETIIYTLMPALPENREPIGFHK